MDAKEFEAAFEKLVDQSRNVLVEKAKEYADDKDRLHNFKMAANLVRGTPEQALWGFVTKHLVSLIDMIDSGNPYPEAVWNEKIGDSVNYFILLRALVDETGRSIPSDK